MQLFVKEVYEHTAGQVLEKLKLNDNGCGSLLRLQREVLQLARCKVAFSTTRPDQTRPDQSRQDKTRQGKARQNYTTQHDNTQHDTA